ncbi:TadE/TadG family type IV pilus assembly protein [Aestuariibius sp. 2305UL40-4]|uniref:TadE/TadG family type IV pilus assembly protein n=1 Tax=Aestuariibius violaceus TaxID=3234132 RepID=UPI00398F40EB
MVAFARSNHAIWRHFRHFRKQENGSSTIEFAILFPPVILLFLAAVEVGLYSMRHVALERGTDISVRAIRLNLVGLDIEDGLTSDILRDLVCASSFMIPNCQNSVRVQLTRLDPEDVGTQLSDFQGRTVDCVDRDSGSPMPVVPYGPPASNELMVVRVCAIFDPVFPTTGFFANPIPKQPNTPDMYALVSTSAFAVEPIPNTTNGAS